MTEPENAEEKVAGIIAEEITEEEIMADVTTEEEIITTGEEDKQQNHFHVFI